MLCLISRLHACRLLGLTFQIVEPILIWCFLVAVFVLLSRARCCAVALLDDHEIGYGPKVKAGRHTCWQINLQEVAASGVRNQALSL